MTLENFTAFDLIVFLVLGLSVVVALVRGAVREILGLASWIGAAVVTWFGFSRVRPLLLEAIGHDLLTDAATFAVVFVIPLIVFKLLAHAIAAALTRGSAGIVDRILGIAFGLLRGAFIVSAGYLAALIVLERGNMPDWVQRAATRPSVERGAEWLAGFLPPDLTAQSRDAANRAIERARALRASPGSYPEDANRALDRLLERVEPAENRP